jgi:2-C-methyl-D-erythritol 4-phosphate cytidylyltransferase
MRNIAVILAGGTGSRMGSALPKQLIEVGGRPILTYSARAFDSCPDISEIILMMVPGYEAAGRELMRPYGKVRTVLEGGASRTESTMRALEELRAEADDARVLFHDAARPFVDHGIIGRALRALEEHQAVAVGLPVTDTIVEVAGDAVTAMPPRAGLWRFQTPQGFRLGTIRAAYEKALADPEFTATDDCGVVHRYLPGVSIPVVEGSERNLKVTHPFDITIAETLANDI